MKNTKPVFSLDEINKKADLQKNKIIKSVNKIKWLDFDTLPNLSLLNEDKEISKQLTVFILDSLIKSKNDKFSKELKFLLSSIEKKTLNKFAKLIYETCDFKSKNDAWVINLLSLYSKDKASLKYLSKGLKKSINNNNFEFVKLTIKTMLKLGKKDGFRAIARLLNIDNNYKVERIYYEFADKTKSPIALRRLITDYLGFDSKGRQKIDYGTTFFTISINDDLSFKITDSKGGVCDILPKPDGIYHEKIARKSYNYFNKLKRDFKDSLLSKKINLDADLINNFLVDLEDWKIIFIENPIYNRFIRGLVWKSGNDTFRLLKNNKLINNKGESYKANKKNKISLVHPLDLSSDELTLWKNHLKEHNITQPFNQLDKLSFSPRKEQLEFDFIDDFKAKFIDIYDTSFRDFQFNSIYKWQNKVFENLDCYYKSMFFYEVRMFITKISSKENKFSIDYIKFYKNEKLLLIKDVPNTVFSEIYMEVKTLVDNS